MRRNSSKTLEILLVEDNPDDVLLTKEAFEDGGARTNISVVENGLDAVRYLKHEAPYETAARPDLILLDLNLPQKSGLEVLEDIKCDDKLKDIPIAVLTTSKAENDISRSYLLHANCYIIKPVDFNRFLDIVNGIETFWFSVVTLPGEVRQ